MFSSGQLRIVQVYPKESGIDKVTSKFTTINGSAVDFFPVADPNDEDKKPIVLNLVDHSVISKPDAQEIVLSSQLLDAVRTRIGGEGPDGMGHLDLNGTGEFPQLLGGGRLQPNGVTHVWL